MAASLVAGATLPLIVTGAGAHEAGTAAPGARTTRRLASIGGAAVSETKKDAPAFWRWARGTARRGRVTLAAGMRRIWLDGRTRVGDDESNAQIGVPAAWRAGYDGTGVTVGILDTGYDPDHPDLRDVVTAAEDFTGSGTGTRDGNGHGTHTASTIAGSGAASGGRYAGVAPGAKLVVGKVCDDDGACPDSAVIAGMEWAASRARIVSMSLGSEEGSDGTDPIAQAVDRLTAGTGTLFVAAAGNAGRPQAVGTPAAADSALAVGSVDKKDAGSRFSSRGPRRGDLAVKPDITAPGEAIVAARAAGTLPDQAVDQYYARLSGTSMATPHVSGAAAILAQRHPAWRAGQLKAALMGAAAPNPALDVFTQGAGRVDAARAVTQHVYATPASLAFGGVSAPFPGKPAVTRTVTYHNEGDAAVTLTPTLTARAPGGGSVPDATFTLGAAEVTVPAHGTADLPVTLDPAKLGEDALGTYDVRLVAASTDRATAVQTPVGLVTEPESYDVTFTLVDRDGHPAVSTDMLQQNLSVEPRDLAVPGPGELDVSGGKVTAHLARGEYGVAGLIQSPRPDGTLASTTLAAVPKLTVDHDQQVTLDARSAAPVRAVVDAPGAERKVAWLEAHWAAASPRGDVDAAVLYGTGAEDLYAYSTGDEPAAGARFTFGYRTTVLAPPAGSHGLPQAYYLTFASPGRVPASPTYRVRDRQLGTELVSYSAQGMDALGTKAEWVRYVRGQSLVVDVFVDVPFPSRRIERFTARRDVSYQALVEQRPTDVPRILLEGALTGNPRHYRQGSFQAQEWNRGVLGPNLSDDTDVAQVVRVDDTLVAFVPMFSPSEAGHTEAMLFDAFGLQGSTTLYKDGALIGGSPFVGVATVRMPTGDAATYRLEVTAKRPYRWTDLAPRIDAAWSFTSKRGAPRETQRLPLMTVRIRAPFDSYGRAPAFDWFPLDLLVEGQAGAPVHPTSVSLEASFDGGTTWNRVWVRGNTGNTYHAVVFNPARGDGYVSLRVRAADGEGNSVEQTIYRAYKTVPTAGRR